jgi:hypothetical protein
LDFALAGPTVWHLSAHSWKPQSRNESIRLSFPSWRRLSVSATQPIANSSQARNSSVGAPARYESTVRSSSSPAVMHSPENREISADGVACFGGSTP